MKIIMIYKRISCAYRNRKRLSSSFGLNLLLITVSQWCLIGCSDSISKSSQSKYEPPPPVYDSAIIDSTKEKEIAKVIDGLSTLRGMEPLKTKSLQDSQEEIRMWRDDGFGNSNLLVLQKSEGNWDGRLLGVGTTEDVGSSKMRAMTTSRKVWPKSGWASVETLIHDAGLSLPLVLFPDADDVEAIPDEPLTIAEIRTGASYDFVWFRGVSKTTDALRFFALCRNLELDFDIIIPCT